MQKNLLNEVKNLNKDELLALLDDFTEAEIDELLHDWELWARPKQLAPQSLENGEDWVNWLILAGRGFGKTRTGAEWVRQQIRAGYNFVNLMGATSNDARGIMVDGESGILACCSKRDRPEFKTQKNELHWPNGAISRVFTADSPERLRGQQHSKIWADELCSWRYIDSWDQAMFGLRLGDKPQTLITTTPKPTPLINQIYSDPLTYVTRGSTYENKSNLAKNFIDQIAKKYEGTRLGRQELYAEILADNPGALWKRSMLDLSRVSATTQKLIRFRRIVVAIDPAVSNSESSDETGIVVAGLGEDGRGYILEDASMKDTPTEWAKIAIGLYYKYGADRIIAEVNQGGDLVETVIRQIDTNVSYKSVRASKGKFARAEPIAALYEQGRVSHVGFFSDLESQLCDYDPTIAKKSPDRLDALVWALTELMLENQNGILDYVKSIAANVDDKDKLKRIEEKKNKIAEIFSNKKLK